MFFATNNHHLPSYKPAVVGVLHQQHRRCWCSSPTTIHHPTFLPPLLMFFTTNDHHLPSYKY
jgi:hypothetical protein